MRDYLDSTRSLEPERKPSSLRQILDRGGRADAAGSTGPTVRPSRSSLADDPADFVTDPGLLRQIVINLLTNALDAVERGGRIALARRAWPSDEVIITVNDTGTGISPEDLRRIFEPFYTTKGRGKGTGLGLAICRELVAALGGQHRRREHARRGLDLHRAAAAAGARPRGREPRPVAAAGGGGMTRVLVAEDDAVARDLLCEILRGEGFEVEAVDDGAVAVERASARAATTWWSRTCAWTAPTASRCCAPSASGRPRRRSSSSPPSATSPAPWRPSPRGPTTTSPSPSTSRSCA